MTHTLPDYTTKYKLAKIFGNVDNAELAARLGACSTLDRRGNTIWYDDFEGGAAIKWTTQVSGAGTVAVVDTRAWMGSHSMATVTGALLNDFAYFIKGFSLPIEREMGAEVMFHIAGGKPLVGLRLVGATGTVVATGKIKYDHNDKKIYYYTTGGAWVELTRVDDVLFNHENWIYLKLVVDWDKGEYVRFIFGSTTYSMAGIPLFRVGSVTDIFINVYITIDALSAAVATVYWDNFVLTQNEP